MPAILWLLAAGGAFYLLFKGTAPAPGSSAAGMGQEEVVPVPEPEPVPVEQRIGVDTETPEEFVGRGDKPETASPPPYNPFREGPKNGFSGSYDDIIDDGLEDEAPEDDDEEEEEV